MAWRVNVSRVASRHLNQLRAKITATNTGPGGCNNLRTTSSLNHGRPMAQVPVTVCFSIEPRTRAARLVRPPAAHCWASEQAGHAFRPRSPPTGAADLAPVVKGLPHERAHRAVSNDPAIWPFGIPLVRCFAVRDVSEAFVARLRAGIVLLDTQLGIREAAGADATLSLADEQRADAARLQRGMHRSLVYRSGVRVLRVVDASLSHRQVRRCRRDKVLNLG